MWKKKPAPEPEDPMARLVDMTMEEQMIAGENVMVCRDLLNLFMTFIARHRADGHDCLPYCIPRELNDYFEKLGADELKMMLTVTLKDMYQVYLQFQAAGGES